jgi:hypothetical protein
MAKVGLVVRHVVAEQGIQEYFVAGKTPNLPKRHPRFAQLLDTNADFTVFEAQHIKDPLG